MVSETNSIFIWQTQRDSGILYKSSSPITNTPTCATAINTNVVELCSPKCIYVKHKNAIS